MILGAAGDAAAERDHGRDGADEDAVGASGWPAGAARSRHGAGACSVQHPLHRVVGRSARSCRLRPGADAWRRWRARAGSTVAMRSMAAVIAFFTATRARSWLEPVVRARPPRPVARASSASSASRSARTTSRRPVSAQSSASASSSSRSRRRCRYAVQRPACRPPRPVRTPRPLRCRRRRGRAPATVAPGGGAARAGSRSRAGPATARSPSGPTSHSPPGAGCRWHRRAPSGVTPTGGAMRRVGSATTGHRAARRSPAPGPAAAGRSAASPSRAAARAEGVVGDAVEHHRAGVDHRAALVRREQAGRRLDDVPVADGQRGLEHALQGQQPVDVARQVVEHAAVERPHQRARAVRVAGADPQVTRPRAERGDALGAARTPRTRPRRPRTVAASPDWAAE